MHLLHFLSSFYYQAEEIASVSFSLIKKWKSILPGFFPPHFFAAFLSHRGMCDERALLMWSCRDPFHCQQHRFFCRTLSDEFACFRFCLCVLLCVCVCVCSSLIMCVKVFPYRCRLFVHISVFAGACHVSAVRGDASGTCRTTPAVITTAWSAPTSSSTVRLVFSTAVFSDRSRTPVCRRGGVGGVTDVTKKYRTSFKGHI